MPAPTALLKKDSALPVDVPLPELGHDEEQLLDAPSVTLEPVDANPDADMIDEEGRPHFPAAQDTETLPRRETRKIRIPPHRMSPLKRAWMQIATPVTTNLKLDIRMNTQAKVVELRTSKKTVEPGASIQKAEDFIRAFTYGFDVEDAIALVRVEGIFIQSFEVKDVKNLQGEHLARAIGRLAGKDGKTKFAIENVSRTRIVLADSKIHILGGFKEIGIARESLVSLILGKPPGKVYGNLRSVSTRMKERF